MRELSIMAKLVETECLRCGKIHRVPETAKGKLACGCGKATMLSVCKYRGQEIGRLDCRCGGKPVVYWCNNLQEPCMERTVNKPWASIKILPNEGWQITAMPVVCATCPLRTEKA